MAISIGAPVLLKSVNNSGTSLTTVAVGPLVTSAAIGDLVVVAVSYGGTGTQTVSCSDDAGGNTYTQVSATVGSDTHGDHIHVLYCKLATGLTTSNNLSIAFGAAVSRASIAVYKSVVSGGVWNTTALDQTTGAQGTGTAPSSGNVTTLQANELLFGAVSTNGVQTLTQGSGWTLLNTLSNTPLGLGTEYQVVTGTGTFTADGTLTSTNWASIIATFAATAPPTNTVAPAVSGTATVGSSLSTTNGTWTGSPTFTYQWQRDNTGGGSYGNISSATSSSYTLTNSDDACNIRCVVTGTNGGGNASANSNSVGTVTEPVPVNSVPPVASGTATVGSSVSTTNGTWSNMSGSNPTFTYQWQRDVLGNLSYSNISSATSSSYTLVDADDGCHVRCVVKATNTGGNASANSNALGLVLEPGVPVNTVPPVVSGTTTVGQILSSTTGTFTNIGGTTHTYAYQWQRDAQGSGGYSDISSATSSTYTLVNADDACHIRCVVKATNDVGQSSGANSNSVGTVVEPTPSNSVAPTASGLTTVGASVSVTTGTWANMAGFNPAFTYQWQRDNAGGFSYSNIATATSNSYALTSSDLACHVRCVVTATNTGGNAAANSNALGPVTGGGSTPGRAWLGENAFIPI